MVTLVEERHPSGQRAVRLRNDHLEVMVLPESGGEIHEVWSLAHQIDLLWKTPWGLRSRSETRALSHASTGSPAAFLDGYAGGWQVLFPNAGDACVYRGAELPFHGEATALPWQHALVRGEAGCDELRLDVRCVRTPFRLARRLSLDPRRPLIRLVERIVNEGAEAVPFMWGHHPAFGAPFLADDCRLYLPARAFVADANQPAPQTWLVPGRQSAWPEVDRAGGGTVDLSHVAGPEARTANLGYAVDLHAGWYALVSPRLRLGVGMTWPLEVFPYVWLWQEFRGTPDYPWYGIAYVMGVEPHTSYPGRGLLTALERGTARWLGPGESLEATLHMVLFDVDDGEQPVQGISADGTVEFAA